MSFAVHIPLVCFGVSFPAMVLFTEGLWMRTGDATYRRLAKRWSHVMAALFAVGVVTGTILSFELGLLWPDFMTTFGGVFGLAFALEGFSFFIEAIFIAIYIYGWDRLSPRAHLLSGVPAAIAGRHRVGDGDRRQRLDEPPDGFDVVAGHVTTCIRGRPSSTASSGTSSCTCTSPATWSRRSWSPASTRGRG